MNPRFPSLTPAELHLVKELFQAAADLPRAEQDAWLASQSASENVRAQAALQLRMLAEAPEAVVGATSRPAPADEVTIDRYRLLERIGEGGFGVVWRAEQLEPIVRIVALKVIKVGMDTRQVVARFEAERQALAQMDHPHIAKVLDAGATSSGRPFFAMELVDGVSITEYCETAGLSMRARLELFCDVCLAVQHAHHKGVIHRDLKPSNILVTERDGAVAPKVIDFGIAKATGSETARGTLLTLQYQILGTPEYMAPEQAAQDPAGVDTRADVYSLGVVLYELLTGTLPIDARVTTERGYLDAVRAIRETEPTRPSTRALDPALRGDLDWIVLRALEKDRERRYGSPQQLAADITRHLDDEPVSARAPTSGYLLRKFVRRHRLQVAAGLAVFVALLGGIIAFAIANAVARARGAELERTAYAAELSLVQDAIGAGQFGRLAERLERLADSPSRGMEWDWVMAHARRPEPRWLLQEAGPIASIDVAPNGGRAVYVVVAAGESADAQVVDLTTAERGPGSIETLSVKGRRVRTAFALFTADGERIATQGMEPGTIALSNAATLERVSVHRVDAELLTCAARSARGDLWAVGCGATGRIKVLRALDQPPVCETGPIGARIETIDIRRDGRLLAVGLETGITQIRAADSGEVLHEFPKPYDQASVLVARFDPDGKRLVVGWWGGAVTLWDAESGQRLADLAPHQQTYNTLYAVNDAVFSADGFHVFTAGNDRRIRLQLAETERGPHPLAARELTLVTVELEDEVDRVAVVPSGSEFLVGDRGGGLRLFDLATVPMPVKLMAHPYPAVMQIACSADGSCAWSASLGTVGLRKWDLRTGALLWVVRTSNARSLALSPDESIVAVGRRDGGGYLVDARTGEVLRQLALPEELRFRPFGEYGADQKPSRYGLIDLAFSPRPGGPLAAALGNDDLRRPLDAEVPVCLFDVATGELARRMNWGQLGAIYHVAFNADGSWFASQTDLGAHYLWRVDRGAAPIRFADARFKNQNNEIAFHPDGQRLFAGKTLDTIAEYAIGTGTQLAEHVVEAQPLRAMEFDREGSRLLLASGDRVALWDVPPRNRVWSAPLVDWGVNHACLVPGGRGVLVGSDFGQLVFHGNADPATFAQRQIERRAVAVVDELLESRNHVGVVPVQRARERLAALTDVDGELRRAAERILAATRDAPDQQNRIAWSVVGPEAWAASDDSPDARAARAADQVDAVRDAARLAPRDSLEEYETRDTLGVALVRVGAFAEAVEELSRAIEVGALWASADVRNSIGFRALARLGLGERAAAEADAARCSEVPPVSATDAATDRELAAAFGW